MRIAIVGSRDFEELWRVVDYVHSLPDGTVVVSGGANGVDKMAARAARVKGFELIEFIPDWTRGKGAGFTRNWDVVQAADEVVAFWTGTSNGTAHTISLAMKLGKPCKVWNAEHGGWE